MELHLQVLIPSHNLANGKLFYLMCPGENERYHTLKISHDGTVNRNLRYNDLCEVSELSSEPEYHKIIIAYNNDPSWFEIDDQSNTMIEYPLSLSISNSKENLFTALTYEVLKVFFNKYKLVPNWINCNYNWGWYDENTGKWTGAVGKVYLNYVVVFNFST